MEFKSLTVARLFVFAETATANSRILSSVFHIICYTKQPVFIPPNKRDRQLPVSTWWLPKRKSDFNSFIDLSHHFAWNLPNAFAYPLLADYPNLFTQKG